MSHIKLKDIPKEERPIERMIEKGSSSLNNEELLAILLKTGSKNMSVKVLASQILKEVKSIKYLKNITIPKLLQIEGIGISKAATIIAAIELSKRMQTEVETIQFTKFLHTETVYKYYKEKLRDTMQEQFYAIYLDIQKQVIREKLLFMGTLNYSMVHPREIFKEGLLVNAASIICIHNHPSGDITPSTQDIKITEKLKEIGLLLNIPILDHLIIGKGYYSFYENGNI